MNSLIQISIPKRTSACAEQGEKLLAGMEIYSLITEGSTEQLSRKDYCLGCWNKMFDSVKVNPMTKGYWKSKIEIKKEIEGTNRIERALSLLRSWRDVRDPNEEEIFVLCLFLSRARQIALRQEIECDGALYHLYEILHTEEFVKVKTKPLSELQIEIIQKSLAEKL